LGRLVEQAVELTRPKWKDQALSLARTVTLDLDLQPVPQIPGDEAQLREALMNLIFNAVDAMPDGGTITVRTSRTPDSVMLEVSDTGTGMTDEVRSRCQEPFFTTKGQHGTGLGLSMVYGILQRHSGTLEIQSALGKGTTFRMSFSLDGLPQVPASTAPAEPGQRPQTVPQLRVLVVDDEEAVRGIIVAYLQRDGHRVETAGSGQEALQKFHPGKFDLVITDRAMPRMNGDALAQAIKRSAPQQPVILLTGFGDLMGTHGEHPEGVDVVLGKPVSLAVLRNAIRRSTGNG
jgi:CheY-like chemotaxis protein